MTPKFSRDAPQHLDSSHIAYRMERNYCHKIKEKGIIFMWRRRHKWRTWRGTPLGGLW